MTGARASLRALAVTAIAAAVFGASGCGDDEVTSTVTSSSTTSTSSTTSASTVTTPTTTSSTTQTTSTAAPTTTQTTTGSASSSADPTKPDGRNNDTKGDPNTPEGAFDQACEENPSSCG